MFNTQMIERLSAERNSELARLVQQSRRLKETGPRGSGVGVRYLRHIGGLLDAISSNVKSLDRSDPAVPATGVDR